MLLLLPLPLPLLLLPPLPLLLLLLLADPGRGQRGAGLQEEARLLERMAAAVTRMLEALLAGLDARARTAYRSPAQAALHMANNAQFLVKAIESSKDLKALCGPWWEQNKVGSPPVPRHMVARGRPGGRFSNHA